MPDDKTPMPTKAQAELLIWLLDAEIGCVAARSRVERPWVWEGRAVEFSGGDLIGFYSEREQAKNPGSYKRGGYASHGWRRAGGTALKNLANRGFVESSGFSGTGIPTYVLTDDGRRWAKQWVIEPGQIRGSVKHHGWYYVVRPVARKSDGKPNGQWWVSRHDEASHAEPYTTTTIRAWPLIDKPLIEIFGPHYGEKGHPWSEANTSWDPR